MTPQATTHLFDFVVEENAQVADGIWRMVMRSEHELVEGLLPGMFVNVKPWRDSSQILRIPLSFASTDKARDRVEIVYAVVGLGTRRLAEMGPGATSTVVGPLGHGWRLPASRERALLVAGGVGLPPIVAATAMLREDGIDATCVVGAQTSSKLWRGGLDRLVALGAEVHVATDDGTEGTRGFTTDVMRDLVGRETFGSVYTCGPTPMMAGVAQVAQGVHIACQASLERMMTCGFGACSTCNVALVRGGYASCCMDGPVFDAEEVAW